MASTFRRRSAGSAAAAATDATERSTTASASSRLALAAAKGTKAWTAGSVLVSTGLRELDAILGGGQPLGSCIHLEQDRFSALSDCLVRYWCAEALSQEQALLIPVTAATTTTTTTAICSDTETTYVKQNELGAIRELLDALPRNLHKDKQQQQQQQQKRADDSATTVPLQLDTLAEEEEDDDDDEQQQQEEEGLVVAWQYRKDVQQERLGLVPSATTAARSSNTSRKKTKSSNNNSVFCHSYDLQGRLADQIDVHAAATIVPFTCCWNDCSINNHHDLRQCGFAYYRQLLAAVTTASPRSNSNNNKLAVVMRVLIYHADVAVLAVALPLFLHYIRLHKLPVVVLVAVQPWTAATADDDTTMAAAVALQHLRRCADVVLSAEGFVSRSSHNYPPPPEFRHLHGLLHVRKAATCTLASAAGHYADFTVQKRPAATLYGMQRDRRKLNVALLHIPPEEYAAAGGGDRGGSVGSGAARSGAGRSNNTNNKAQPGGSAVGGCSSSGGNSPLDF